MSALPRVDKLEIQSTLGRGAMGVVYKAYDPFMDRAVAVKMLRTDVLDSDEREDFSRRFRGEAKAYGRLLHPNIVTCHSYNETEGQTYIVMEYVEGKSLKEHLDRGTRFSLPQVREIMLQLLSALAYSHAHGVIHRDIKPANVLLTVDGRIKVTDFGIARVEAAAATSHTQHVVGSPSYMSPEQFSGRSVDARSDIYSAGLVLYELLTGARPFPNSDLSTALYNVLYSEPEAPSRRNARVSVQMDRVVLKSLQKDPDQRYRSAAAFMDDVEHCFAARVDESDASRPELSGEETRVITETRLFDTLQVTQQRQAAMNEEPSASARRTQHRAGSPATPAGTPTASAGAAASPSPEAAMGSSTMPAASVAAARARIPSAFNKRKTALAALLGATGVASAALVWMAGNHRLPLFDSIVQERRDEQVAAEDAPVHPEAAQAVDKLDPTKSAVTTNPTSATADSASLDSANDSAPASAPDKQMIVAALQSFPCAHVAATIHGPDVMLSGFVSSPQDVATAQQRVADMPGVRRVTADVRVVTRPYCDLLALLHPLRGTGPGTPIVPDEEQVMRFREGDALALELKTPPYEAYMYVDYFLLDGQVVHLLPNELEKDNHLPAGQRTRIGEPGPGKRHWEVSPPFGREMITIVASRKPLSLGDRPEVESVQDYLPAMRAALSNAGDKQITANYTFIETHGRNGE